MEVLLFNLCRGKTKLSDEFVNVEITRFDKFTFRVSQKLENHEFISTKKLFCYPLSRSKHFSTSSTVHRTLQSLLKVREKKLKFYAGNYEP